MTRRTFLLSTAGPILAAPARSAAVDWKRLAPEILEHFTSLVRIDTSNPPGNETRAASYLKRALADADIPSQLYALEPNRANLVARIKGSGGKRPLLIMGHTDVVGAQRERWKVEPFAAIRNAGYIYGRGTIDDKDTVTAALFTMLLLKRQRVPLARDVIFLAEAGEEGTTSVGIDYMVKEHWPEIECEFALAEGGGGMMRSGRVRYVTVSTTEKVPRGFTLRAHGTAGHASVPTMDNAVIRIAEAVARIARWQPSVRLNETTRTYFARLAAISPPEVATHYRDVLHSHRARAAAQYLSRREPANASMLRTTIVPTVIRAGFRSNVIPSDAEALLDIRALPDEDIAELTNHLRRLINDPGIDLIPRGHNRPTAAPSRADTPAFAAIERVQQNMYPEATTLPAMLTGATDLAQLRARGVQAYGLGPCSDESESGPHGAHGDEERVSERALLSFCEFLWRAVIEIAGMSA